MTFKKCFNTKRIELESIDLEKAQFLCSLPKSLG